MIDKLEKIALNIYHLHYNTLLGLKLDYCRFSCEYDYFKDDIKGYTICSDELEDFLADPSAIPSLGERAVLQLLEQQPNEMFCVIGTHRKSTVETFFHELAHCFMYLVPKYREEVQASVGMLNYHSWRNLRRFLRDGGYESMTVDEMQAYVISDLEEIDGLGLVTPAIQRWHKELNQIFTKSIDDVEWTS